MKINASFEAVSELVRTCLGKLYSEDAFLFQRNHGGGVCERALVFRFAYYLQQELEDTPFKVDCDFDRSFQRYVDDEGETRYSELDKKKIRMPDGSYADIYPDIIVHTRNFESWNDFVCFEFKKEKYDYGQERKNDLYKLERMTSDFDYHWGFHISLGKKKETTRWTVYQKTEEHQSNQKFENQTVF